MDWQEECAVRLEDSYQRLLLRHFQVRRLPVDLTDAELRDRFREMLGQAGAAASEGRVLDELVGKARENDRRYPEALRTSLATLRRFVPQVKAQQEALGGAPIVATEACVGAFVFPGAAFNATTLLSDEGDYLILVNLSLLEMIWQAAKLFAVSTHLADGMFSYLDRLKNSPAMSPARALARILGFYIGLPLGGRDLVDPQAGSDRIRAQELFQSCVLFIVGHEYAHILAGHIDPDVPLHAGKHDLPDANEVAADWLGLMLALGEWRWGDFGDDQWHTRFQTRLGGPLFFFALEQAVAAAEEKLGVTLSWSVAPPRVRRAFLEPFCNQLAGSTDYRAAYPLAHDCENWIYRMEDELRREIGRLDGSAGRLRTWDGH